MPGVVTLQYGLQNVGRVRCSLHIICRDRDTVPPCWIDMAWTRNSGHDDIVGSGVCLILVVAISHTVWICRTSPLLGFASMDFAYDGSFIARP